MEIDIMTFIDNVIGHISGLKMEWFYSGKYCITDLAKLDGF